MTKDAVSRPLRTRTTMLLATLGVGVVLALALGALRPWQPVEVVYEGRLLSAWLDDFQPTQPLVKRQAASKALQTIGTNAIPDLIVMASARDHVVKRRLMRLTSKRFLLRMRMAPSWLDHRRAVEGFRVLGPRAEIAVGPLIKLLESDLTAHVAVDALAKIGYPAVHPLIAVIQNGDAHRSMAIHAVRALGQMGWEAKSAIPHLVSLLESKDYRIRAESIQTLEEIGEGIHVILPPLTTMLNDPHPHVRQSAARALGDFRDEAAESVGTLIKTLYDVDPYVRFAAIEALSKIDPIAAEKGTNILRRARGSD